MNNKKITLKINYNTNVSELCKIGQKYDTYKSPQRNNLSKINKCYPYTLFYDSLFKNYKNNNINIAEIGIFNGESLLMWQEYFTNATIHGFDSDNNLISNSFNKDRIQLYLYNINTIKTTFNNTNILYDIIIDNTTNDFNNHINFIENIYHYLKPGGILIIENISNSYNENEYISKLSNILTEFQNYYFIELEHNNTKSIKLTNSKLFILIKNGSEPIFKNNNKITIITPSYRTQNLIKLKQSINFNYIDEWIIVYDENKIIENPNLFINQENNKIKEYIHKSEGISGNPQRNFALTKITNPNTLLYYLDDDNIIHSDIYTLFDIIDSDKLYTFNHYKGIKGNNIQVRKIDTSMAIIPYKLYSAEKWILNLYDADGRYISSCYNKNTNIHIYVDNDLSYYNKLSK